MADEKTYTKEQLDAAVEAAVEKATGDVDGLKAKVEELIASEKKWKAEARKAKEIDPAEVDRLHNEVEELQGKLTAAEKSVKDATAAAEKATKALEKETAFTQKLLISDGLKSALIANGVKDEAFIDALTAKLASGATVVAEGDVRKAMIGDKPLEDAVKEFAASDQGKKFVSAPANSGGGAEGGRKVNADAKTITRSAYNALDPVQRGEVGLQSAKGEVKIVDEAA